MIRNWGIYSRILLLALVPLVCLGILLGTYLTRVRVHDLQASEHILGNMLANQLASASEFGVFSHNIRILQTLAHNVSQEPGVDAITIKDKHNNILAQVIQPAENSRGFMSRLSRLISNETGLANTLTFTRPIYLRSISNDSPGVLSNISPVIPGSSLNEIQMLGKVTVKLSERHFAERQTQIIVNGASIILGCLVFSILLALVIAGSVAVPITRVIDMVSHFTSGDHTARVPEHSGGEIGRLESGINLMAANAEYSEQELQSQVDQATSELRETMEEMEVKSIELDLARKRALEASRVKSEFLSNTSHEIRTPMNAIIGFTGLLAKTRLNKDQRYYLDTVQHSASNLLTVINDVLDLQSLEAGSTLQTKSFNLRELLEEAVKLLAPEAYMKKLELIMHMPADLPVNYMGDSVKLSRVLINLLSNAVKFTERGFIKLSVYALEIFPKSIKLCISMRDTGIGIPTDDMKNIFKPFTMLNVTTNQLYQGTGLGLSISRQLMDSLGGTLTVASLVGEGSEFRAELTLELIDAPTRVVPANTGKRVFLYEPNPEMAAAMQERLKGFGYSVSAYQNLVQLSTQLKSANREAAPLLLLSLGYDDMRDYAAVRDLVINHPFLPVLLLINSLESSVHKHITEAIGGICLPKCVANSDLESNLHQLLPLCVLDTNTKINTHPPRWRPLKDYKILIVEDNRINRQLIVLQLRELGAVVVSAEDGATALTAFVKNRPHAILLDMRLGKERGLEVASRLNAASAGNPVPIIMLSASSENESIDASRSLGICRWLLKPVDENVLVSALLAVLPGTPYSVPIKDDSFKELDIALGTLRPEILGMLRHDLVIQQQAIVSAWESKDMPAMREALHVMHGTAAMCKLLILKSYCRSMEAVMNKQSKSNEIPQLVIKIKEEVDRINTMLDFGSEDSKNRLSDDSVYGSH